MILYVILVFTAILIGMAVSVLAFGTGGKRSRIFQDIYFTVEEVEGIGEVMAATIIRYFHDEQNLRIIERLRSYGLQFALSAEQTMAASDKLKGQSVVISGVFQHHSRDEYKLIIEQNGGKNVGSISSKTSFILAGDNMGPSKLEKAKKLGIRIMSEAEFLEMVNDEG